MIEKNNPNNPFYNSKDKEDEIRALEAEQIHRYDGVPRHGHNQPADGLNFGHIDRRRGRSRRPITLGRWVKNPTTGEMEKIEVTDRGIPMETVRKNLEKARAARKSKKS